MVLSDEGIKKRIIDELYWDTRVDASKVLVKVENARVTLSGTAPNYSARIRAGEDAYRVPDVAWVDNFITVQYPPTIPAPSDTDIERSVEDLLSADPDMDLTDIRVSVRNGTITLKGSVDEYWKKWEAGRIACRARGICDIVNELTVVPTMSITDKAIADDIRAAIERNRDVNIEDVDIEVENKVVTLSGSVPNWMARQAAVDTAEYTKGVVDVIDDLIVSAPVTVERTVC
jgi:osmotically-inducible protein OsmY